MKARVIVTLKTGVLDPQARPSKERFRASASTALTLFRQGKVFELDLDGTDAPSLRSKIEAMCDKLLANTVIEN